MTWLWLKTKWDAFRGSKFFWPVMIAICMFALGFYVGHRNSGPTIKTEVRTVEDTESMIKLSEALNVQQQLQEQLTMAQNQISEMKIRTVEVVHTVYLKDGTKTIDEQKTTDVDNKTDTKITTVDTKKEDVVVVDTKKEDIADKTHTDTKTITTVSPKDDFMLGISAGVDLDGVGGPGLEFKYRIFDLGKASIWGGAEVFVGPPMDFRTTQFRLSVSASF